MLVSNRFQQHFKKQRFLTEKRWRWKWSRPRNGWQGEQPELGHSCNHLAWRWDVGRQTDGFCLGFQCPNWDLYDLYNMYAYIYILDWFIYIYISKMHLGFVSSQYTMESKMMQLVFTYPNPNGFKFQNPNWVSPSRWVSSAKWDFTPRFIGLPRLVPLNLPRLCRHIPRWSVVAPPRRPPNPTQPTVTRPWKPWPWK